MKTLLRAFLAILLCASPSWAAFASVGTLGTFANATGATSIALTTSAACEAGNLCVCGIGINNTNTTDGDFNEITGVTDSGSNTWTQIAEFTNGQGGINAGSTVAIFFTRATTQINSSGTITAALAGSIENRTMSCWEFTVAAAVQAAAAASVKADDNQNGPTSMAIAGLASKEYLFLRCWAQEDEQTFTATTNYTFTGNATLTGMTTRCEFRILTGTGDTSDPGAPGANSDYANIYVALEEITAATRRPVAPIIFK